jgi:bile acid-coenzyme A ligase
MKNPGLYVQGASTAAAVESYGPFPQPQRVLVPAPLYHSNGFTATRNLMSGVAVVLMERFDAERALNLIERHRVTGFVGATPMLQRLAQMSDIDRRDLSSLDWVQQGAALLPVWLGRRWCELVGPEHFFVTYGASERHGYVCCRGDEWLQHPGTVGRGYMDTDIRIIGDGGNVLPAGEVGGIYMRRPSGPEATYMGGDVTPMVPTDDGFVTVGDMGWLDEENYLYVADRRVDMIVTGVVGIPLGIVIGRWLWILFAEEIGAVPDPTVPVLSVIVAAIVALVLGIAAAVVPGRRAARTATALVLHEE